MWYEETDIIFGIRASISIKITDFIFYRKIMLASVMYGSSYMFRHYIAILSERS
jgi:hypothetical protein